MSTRTVLAFGGLLEEIIWDNKYLSKQVKSQIFYFFPETVFSIPVKLKK